MAILYVDDKAAADPFLLEQVRRGLYSMKVVGRRKGCVAFRVQGQFLPKDDTIINIEMVNHRNKGVLLFQIPACEYSES